MRPAKSLKWVVLIGALDRLRWGVQYCLRTDQPLQICVRPYWPLLGLVSRRTVTR